MSVNPDLGVVPHICNPSTWGQRQEEQEEKEFNVIFLVIVCLRPAWSTGDPVSKQKQKRNNSVDPAVKTVVLLLNTGKVLGSICPF